MKATNQRDYLAVEAVMRRHTGAANAITLNEIAIEAGMYTETGIPDRRAVEIILQTCKADFPFIVVGSGKGMYVATDAEDLNHEIKSRLSRIKNIQNGISSVKRKALALGWKLEGDRFTEAPTQQELAL
jgi:hypothetical protein